MMVQQYLPPALMLEQLRNERYRQTAQGLQQGITGALQAYMNMEQLKQAAAQKEAERKERARQFDVTEQRLKAIQEGQLGVRQAEIDRLVAKQKDKRADALRAQGLDDLRRMAMGQPKDQGAIAGVDTQTAREFMQAGQSRFGQKARTVEEGLKRGNILMANLEQLAAEQEANPEALGLAETARLKGMDIPYGEIRGVMAEELADREKTELLLGKLRQDIASGKALETKRLRGRGTGGAGVAKTPKAPFAQIEQSYRSQLNNLTKTYLQGKEGLQKQIVELESAKENPYGDRTPATAEEKAQAEVLRQQLAAFTAEYEENKNVLLANYEETMNRAMAGEPELYRRPQPEQAAAQPTDVGVPEMLARPSEQPVKLSPEDREMQQAKEAEAKQLETELARLTALLGKKKGDVRGTKEFMDLERVSDRLQMLKDPGHIPQAERRQYEAQAQMARQKYVDITPQELEQRLEGAPVAARNRYKQAMARMRRAGLSDADIAAVIGLELSQQIPLARNRI